jgi:hypothetical protein
MNFHNVGEDWLMPEQHLTELIRDSEPSPLDDPNTAKSAQPSDEVAFDEGVLTARMGMKRDDNPYSAETHAYEDWEAGYASLMWPARPAVEIEQMGGRSYVRSIEAGGSVRMHGFDIAADAEVFAESERARMNVANVVRR